MNCQTKRLVELLYDASTAKDIEYRFECTIAAAELQDKMTDKDILTATRFVRSCLVGQGLAA